MSEWTRLRLLLSVLLMFFLNLHLAATDLKVRTVVKTTNKDFDPPRILMREETVFVQGALQRMELLVPLVGETPQPHSAEIVDCESRRGYRADLNRHEYTEVSLPRFPSQQETEKRVIKQEKKARNFEVRTVEARERKVFLGWPARHIVTTVVGKTSLQFSEATIDGWYIDLPPPGCSPDYLRKGRAIEVIVSFLAPPHMEVVYTSFVPPGLAVREIITTTSRFKVDGIPHETVIVVEKTIEEISDAPLDPALFAVPADFTRVDRLSPTLNQPRPALVSR